MSDYPATSVHFQVSIDGADIGTFTSCEGLELQLEVDTWTEGGHNEFVHQLPRRIKYSNIRLTRPVGADSYKIQQWFDKLSSGLKPTSARIVALTHRSGEELAPLVAWTLSEVIPIRWQGPSFTVESAKVASETLELAHHGFKFEKA
ncbi:MAG: phage tail protein [Actinomycetota bacterium]